MNDKFKQLKLPPDRKKQHFKNRRQSKEDPIQHSHVTQNTGKKLSGQKHNNWKWQPLIITP